MAWWPVRRALADRPAATIAVMARATWAADTVPNTAVTVSPARGSGGATSGTRRSPLGSARSVSSTMAATSARPSAQVLVLVGAAARRQQPVEQAQRVGGGLGGQAR